MISWNRNILVSIHPSGFRVINEHGCKYTKLKDKERSHMALKRLNDHFIQTKQQKRSVALQTLTARSRILCFARGN